LSKRQITTEEALKIIVRDKEAMGSLVKHLLGTKCADIGIQYPGSIAELLAKMNTKE